MRPSSASPAPPSVGPLASLGCVDIFNALIKLRPEWDAETLKVVMTGSAEDGPERQRPIGNKEKRRKLANRFKDAKDPFKIVIVREGESPRRLWLTGFDAPCLPTRVADKPMQGHGIMQAIACVRVRLKKLGSAVTDSLLLLLDGGTLFAFSGSDTARINRFYHDDEARRDLGDIITGAIGENVRTPLPRTSE